MWQADDSAAIPKLTRWISKRTCYQIQRLDSGWSMIRLDYDQDRARLRTVAGFHAPRPQDEDAVCALADQWIETR